MSIEPRPVGGSYDQALLDFMREGEGDVRRIYSDHRGIPTLGLGYALAVSRGGTWRLRDGLDADLGAIGVALNDDDRDRLDQAVAALNDGAPERAKALIPEWSASEDTAARNRFGFLLDDRQAADLFDRVRPGYEAALERRLGGPLYGRLAGSREMIALFSLVYNAPGLIGPGLRGAVERGARPEVWYEIRFRSNRDRHEGLQNRRTRESEMFGLYNDDPARDELDEVRAFLESRRARMARYLSEVANDQDKGGAEADSLIALAQARTVGPPGPATA